jgi:hypothetical protein
MSNSERIKQIGIEIDKLLTEMEDIKEVWREEKRGSLTSWQERKGTSHFTITAYETEESMALRINHFSGMNPSGGLETINNPESFSEEAVEKAAKNFTLSEFMTASVGIELNPEVRNKIMDKAMSGWLHARSPDEKLALLKVAIGGQHAD